MPLNKSEYLSPVWRDGIFKNKVVFCTGGAGNICSAQVRALVHLGANACIVGRNVAKTEAIAQDIASARLGANIIGIGAVDVRDENALKAAVERTVKELGQIDFVIAGAAGNFLAPISQLSPNAFKSVIDIDVLGSYNTLKATIPELLKSAKNNPVSTDGKSATRNGTGGRIIFLSATIHYTGFPLQAHAAAAKAAVDQLSVSMAIEYGPLGVTSNVISPGGIEGTEGLDRLSKKEGKAQSARRIPAGRFGGLKDIAGATVYIFSDAGNYVNGEILVVDGGAWHIGNTGPGDSFEYPEFILSSDIVKGVKGTKMAKI